MGRRLSKSGPRSSAGRARLPTITGCTNSTETCCASVAAEPFPNASSRPPLRKRRDISWQASANRGASASKKVSKIRLRSSNSSLATNVSVFCGRIVCASRVYGSKHRIEWVISACPDDVSTCVCERRSSLPTEAGSPHAAVWWSRAGSTSNVTRPQWQEPQPWADSQGKLHENQPVSQVVGQFVVRRDDLEPQPRVQRFGLGLTDARIQTHGPIANRTSVLRRLYARGQGQFPYPAGAGTQTFASSRSIGRLSGARPRNRPARHHVWQAASGPTVVNRRQEAWPVPLQTTQHRSTRQ